MKKQEKGKVKRIREIIKSYTAYKVYSKLDNDQGMYRNLKKIKPMYINKHKYYIQLSLLARKQKKWKDALKYINLAIKQTKEVGSVDLLMSKAKILIRLGDFDEAITCLKKYDSTYPQKPETSTILSDAYRKSKQWKLAIQCLQKYLNMHPTDSKTHIQLANCFRAIKDFTHAEKHYEEALKYIEQLSDKKEVNSTYYWLGNMQLENNHKRQAIQTFNKLIEKDTSLNSQNLGIGIFHEHYKQWEFAVCAYKEHLSEKPFNAEVHFKLATILDKRLYRPSEAVTYYEKALELDNVRSPWHQSLANCYEQLGHYELAATSFSRAIARQEKHRPGNYRRLGKMLTLLGKKDEALEAFGEAELFSKPIFVEQSFYNANIHKEKVRYAISYEHYPVKDNLIFYESLSGTRMMDSPFAIFEHIFHKEDFKQYTHIWVVNSFHVIPGEYKAMENIIFVKKKSDAYFKYISSAKYLICNSTFDPYVVRKPEQKYLQTSHGIFYKTVGRDSAGSAVGVAGSTRNLLQATHIIVPNEYMAKKQPKSYSIRGIHSGDIAKIGYPRIDVTVNMTMEDKNNICTKLGLDIDKKIVLYVPTWRGETKAANRFDATQLINDLKTLAQLDVNVIFRGHPISNRLLKDINIPKNVTIPPPDILTNELLGIADVVISDYSSVFFDFLVTNRPIIHYLYDLETYKKERGLNLSEEELPGTIVKSTEELIEAVENHLLDDTPSDHYLKGKQRFCPYDDGKSTERVVEWFFFENQTDIEFVKPVVNTTNLYLIGELKDQKLFSSLVNDIKDVKEKDNVVTLLFSNSVSKNTTKRNLVAEIDNPNINFVVHDKNMPTTIEEAFAIHHLNKHGAFIDNQMRDYYNTAFKRESRRIFGDTHFNKVKNFDTESSFYKSIGTNVLSEK